jgi:hypothetical protein
MIDFLDSFFRVEYHNKSGEVNIRIGGGWIFLIVGLIIYKVVF